MGQGNSTPQHLSEDQVSQLFAQQCYKTLEPIELYGLKDNFKATVLHKDHGEHVRMTDDEFVTLLGIPAEFKSVEKLLTNSAKFLANFPFMDTKPREEGYSFNDLLKIIVFYSGRYTQVFKEFDPLKLLFVSLLKECDVVKEVQFSEEPNLEFNGDWKSFEPVKQFYATDVSSLKFPRDQFIDFLTFMLVLYGFDPAKGTVAKHIKTVVSQDKTNTKTLFADCRKSAQCIARACAGDIDLVQFRHAFDKVCPHLLKPVGQLFDLLLYTTAHSEKEDAVPVAPLKPLGSNSVYPTKLMNHATVAQMASFCPFLGNVENLKTLYMGQKDGFAQRSFESGTFGWRAPSVLLVSGLRLNTDNQSLKRANTFDEKYPRLKGAVVPDDGENEVRFGFYLDVPWRSSSKETFGSAKCFIFQLAPTQDIFVGETNPSNHAYFLKHDPGGLAFGSPIPKAIGRFTGVQSPQVVGAVSLTLDDSLEFGKFHHSGKGGSYAPSINKPGELMDERFKVRNVEVWGIGNDTDLEHQRKRIEWEEREASYRRHINTENLQEDRAFLEMAGVIGGAGRSGGSM